MNAAISIALGAAALDLAVSTLHFALRDFSLRKLEELAKGNGGMAKLEPIVRDADGHALSLGLVRVALHVVVTIALLMAFASRSEGSVGIAGLSWTAASLIGGGACAAVVLYIVGLVVPLSVARHLGEYLIHAAVLPVRAVHLLATPVRALGFVDEAVKRLAGAHAVTEKEELEDELLSVVSEGEREGNLNETERSMIEGIVDMASMTVEEVMTPRTEIEGIELTDELARIRAFIEQAGHSRIPVWTGDPDHIIGILYAKDLLRFLGQDTGAFAVRPILREAFFVPESKPVTELLVELQAKKVHMAIVLDEYGGTAGLITLEDVLEEIVGEIRDEYEPETEQPPEIRVDNDARSAEIEARASIRDANEALDAIDLELPEHEDYDTVGGYVLSVLGRIPEPGASFSRNGHAVTVLDAEATRVNRLRVEARDDAGEHEPDAQRPDDDAESIRDPGDADAAPPDDGPAEPSAQR